MVFLGFGKYARADKIYALEPLRRRARHGRRTRVWVEGVPEPIVASRTERTILARDGPGRRRSARRSLDEALDARRAARPADAEQRPRRPRRPQPPRAPAARGDRQPGRRRAALLSEPGSRLEPANARAVLARLSRLAVDSRPLRSSPPSAGSGSAQAISAIGSQITTVAIPFQVYKLTARRSPSACSRSPRSSRCSTLSLVGGAIADAVDRRRLLLVTELALAVVASGSSLNAVVGEPQRLGALRLRGCSRPRRLRLSVRRGTRSTPRLVPDDELTAAIAVEDVVLEPRARRRPGARRACSIAVLGLTPAPTRRPRDVRRVARRDLAAARDCRRSRTRSRRACARSLDGLPLRAPQAGPARDLPRRHERDDLRHAERALPGARRARSAAAPALVGCSTRRRTPARSPPRSLSGWMAHVRRQGLGVCVAAALWGVAIAAFGFADTSGSRSCCSPWPAPPTTSAPSSARRSCSTVTPDAMRGRLSGIEFAQVASAPTLGNVEAGVVASLDEPALLDRLGRGPVRRRDA